MTIQLGALKALNTKGPLYAWVRFESLSGVKLRLQYVEEDENDELFGLTDEEATARKVPKEEWRGWHLDRVSDWDGVEDGDDPAPFDRDVIGTAWDRDASFRTELIGGCRRLGNFLRGTKPAPSLAVGADSDRGAA